MNTDIEFLRQLDTDLHDAADRERARLTSPAAAPLARSHRRSGGMWARVAGVAATFLVVAGAIGFVAGGQGGNDRFAQVGDAVAGTGGGDGSGGATEPARGPADLGYGVDGDAPPASGFEDQPVFDENLDDRPSPGRLQDLSKIIRDGRVGVVIPDAAFDEAVGDLTFIAEQHGGFILSSNTQNERSGTFVLRIPAARFDAALADVRDLGNVRFQTITGDDVTAEFIDYQARLRILQGRRTLLFRLFQDADTTDEILRLATQLDDVQLRIEQIQGQIRFINDQVAEATLRVTLQERNAPKAATRTEVDNPSLGSSFDLAVQGFLRIVGAVIVGLGYLIPLTAVAALVWLIVWTVRRRGASSPV